MKIVRTFLYLLLGLEVTDLEAEDLKETEIILPTASKLVKLDSTEQSHFMVQLLEAFLKLHDTKPVNPMLAPACIPG